MKDSIMPTLIFILKLWKKLKLTSKFSPRKILCRFFNHFRIVGHSLGAALATHATAHLIKAGYKVSLFENYGSPRVGDKAFSNWFQQIYPNTLKPRVTHRKDPVPHLPPKEWGFEHTQT
jgi:predicted lipase